MRNDKEKTFFGRRLFGGRSGCCCGPAIVSVRQIAVDGVEVGIKGLDETFEEYYYAGKKPEDLTGDELIEALGRLNYIPAGSAGAYKEAFLREYRKYYTGRKN
ncbi:MAG: hypothetical protein ACP5E9_05065 [Candidatus Methanospirareceae archaeon]